LEVSPPVTHRVHCGSAGKCGVLLHGTGAPGIEVWARLVWVGVGREAHAQLKDGLKSL